MKESVVIIFLLLFFGGCGNKENEKKSIVINSTISADNALKDKGLIDSLLDVSILKGDTIAYSRLFFYYSLAHRESELLPYTIIMANKYNYADAHYYIYLTMVQLRYGTPYEDLDENTKKMTLFHLLKANELGCSTTQSTVNNIYHDKKPPKSDSIWLIKN